MELQNNKVLTWRTIWFHQAVNAKESRLCAQPWPTHYRVSSDFLILNFGSFRVICLISMTFQGREHIFQCQKRLFRENEHKCWANKASKIVMQWCNLILTWWFWATKVCLWAGKISKICFVAWLGEQLLEKQILKIILAILW